MNYLPSLDTFTAARSIRERKAQLLLARHAQRPSVGLVQFAVDVSRRCLLHQIERGWRLYRQAQNPGIPGYHLRHLRAAVRENIAAYRILNLD